ncbi:MAG: TIM44-like domain-containing protein [Pseudomonadota bacterium]
MKKFWSVVLVGALAVASIQAEAARMGGGKSFGRQSSNVTQRQSTPPAATPGAPTQNATNAAPRPATPSPAAAAPKRPWGAMLGGLAAGLGLAWLAHSLGLGAGFGNILLIGLLVFAAFMVWRMFSARSRASGSAGGSNVRPGNFAFGTAGAPAEVSTPAQYSPAHVGNDASARPWERNTAAFDATPAQADTVAGGSSMAGAAAAGSGSMIGAALAGSQAWGIPTGFDVDGFLGAAKRNFVTLQAAWDRADVSTLRSMMTDGMVGEIQTQLADRASHTGGVINKTDVVMLDAKLLGIEEMPDAYMASVEFSGMIREDASSGPSPFREVWNMTKPVSGTSGWLVAGVQALQ